MKRIALIISAVATGIFLAGCSSANAAPSKPAFRFTSGVSKSTAKLDDENYMNIKGVAPSSAKYIEVVYDGDIVDTVTVKNGRFSYHNNGSGGPYKLKFITSKSKIEIGGDPTDIHGKTIAVKVPKSSSDTEDESVDSSDTSSSQAYGLNEKAELADSENNPLVSLTVTSATKTFNAHGQSLVGDDIESIAISNEKTVQFTISYTNEDDSENYLPSIFDFSVYDSNGTAATIVNQQDGQTEVSKGHTASTTFWANFTNDTPKGSKVELEYQPDGMDSPVTFDLTVN